MPKAKGKPSLIISLRRFYASLFVSFVLLTTLAVYNYFLTDYSATLQDSLDLNLSAFKQLEIDNEQALGNLRNKIKALIELESRESLLDFRKNYNLINEQLLGEILSYKELQLFNHRKIPPPVIVLPFNLYEREFRLLAQSIEDLFSERDIVRTMDDFAFTKSDSSIWKELSSLEIKPIIDYDRHLIFLKKSDFKKLDQIDKVNDLQFHHTPFSEKLLPLIMRISSADLIKFNADDFNRIRPAAKNLAKHLDGSEASIQWNIFFFTRKFFRLGIAPHDHIQTLQGSAVERIAERGQFYETSTRQFIWNYFPLNYLNEPAEQDKLLIMPEQYIGASIDHLRLSRSLLPAILKANPPAPGVQVTFPDESEYFIHNRAGIPSPKKISLTDEFPNSLWLNPTNMSWVPIAQSQSWVQKIYRGTGSEDPTPTHFLATDKYGKSLLVSAFFSAPLDRSRVLIYRPWESVIGPFTTKWIGFVSIYLLAMAIFFLQIRKRRILISEAIESCLHYLIIDRQPLQSKDFIPREIELLGEKMTEFNLAIEVKRIQAELNLGFQRILNIPRKDLDFYLDEFFFLTGEVAPDYRWRLVHELVEDQSKNQLEIELDSDHKVFLENIGKKPSIILHFRWELNLEESMKELFNTHFRALVEKAALEHHSMQAERLNAELEVASRISSVLLPPQSTYENIHLNCAVPSNASLVTILLDHENLNGMIHFYLAEFSVKGTPALMTSIHVKAFLKGYRRVSSSPAKILGALNDYLLERRIPDLLLSITYATCSLEDFQINCSTAGHRAFMVNPVTEKSFSISSEDIPLGIQANHSFSEVKLKLSENEIFSIISRTQMQLSFEGSWDERYEHSMRWVGLNQSQAITANSNDHGVNPEHQGFLLIAKKKREIT